MKLCSLLLPAALAALSGFASADLLVNPAGGTALGSGDDYTFTVDLQNFEFYGAPKTVYYASSNGNLNGSATTTTQINNSFETISPLGDDHIVEAVGDFSELTTADYFAFTWSNVSTYGTPSSHHTFQAVLVRQNATIGGVDLQANDIVFAYGMLGDTFRNSDAYVGVSNGDPATANDLPGSTVDGYIDRTQADTLLPTGANYLRYRFNGTGYDRTVVNANPVPEPASLAVLGFGAVALLRRRRRA